MCYRANSAQPGGQLINRPARPSAESVRRNGIPMGRRALSADGRQLCILLDLASCADSGRRENPTERPSVRSRAKALTRRGGGGGIRTHGRREPSVVFKTTALNHSATPPRLKPPQETGFQDRSIRPLCHRCAACSGHFVSRQRQKSSIGPAAPWRCFGITCAPVSNGMCRLAWRNAS